MFNSILKDWLNSTPGLTTIYSIMHIISHLQDTHNNNYFYPFNQKLSFFYEIVIHCKSLVEFILWKNYVKTVLQNSNDMTMIVVC